VDPIELVDLVRSRKEGVQSNQLVQHTSGTPHIHRRAVPSVRQQVLRSAVPPGGDVPGDGLGHVGATAAAEIGEFEEFGVGVDEDVFGFDVAVEYAEAVYVFDGGE